MLMMTVDPGKAQTVELKLLGANLSGDAPTLPIFPAGQRLAVVTTWDDGAETDLRLAKLLHRLGYRPTFFVNQDRPAMKFLDQFEGMNVEVGSHCFHHPFLHLLPPDRAREECVEMRKVLEEKLKHPVVSFAFPNGYSPAYDTDGDYVLRAVKAAGYWSGRTTAVAAETYDSIADPLTLKTNGFFGDRMGLEKAWEAACAKEGNIFAFWGHSWQIGKTDQQWSDFEQFVAKFAHEPKAWYATQGELFLWLWKRKNVRIEVTEKTPGKMTIRLTRPWLHPWLAAQCPLCLKVQPGVEKVVWQGKEITVVNGQVDLPWTAP
jgi:peptidoglycan/xylan/chitin deacetylase (PgdA/CDA1 family)